MKQFIWCWLVLTALLALLAVVCLNMMRQPFTPFWAVWAAALGWVFTLTINEAGKR